MHELILIPDCRIAEVMRADPGSLHVAVHPTAAEASCPVCHTLSRAIHSWYHRHPADLPSLGSEVRLELSVLRFYCRNTLARCLKPRKVRKNPNLRQVAKRESCFYMRPRNRSSQ